MKFSKISVLVLVLALIWVVSGCAGEQVEPAPEEAGSQEATPAEPESEPSAMPVQEEEAIELSDGIRLSLTGVPADVSVEARVDPDVKAAIPDSMRYDYVHSDVVVVEIRQNGGPAMLEPGVAELCFDTVPATANSEDPRPYYWDLTIDPLVDGRPLRASVFEKSPAWLVCTQVQANGAYALIGP